MTMNASSRHPLAGIVFVSGRRVIKSILGARLDPVRTPFLSRGGFPKSRFGSLYL